MRDFTWLEFLVLLCALGSGLVAGVFYAFSTFVMRALGRLPAAQGIAAMQSINIVVINPWFMAVLFGTALLCIAVLVMGWRGTTPALPWLAAGSLSYVLGTIGVTIAFNVPRNDALAKVSPGTPEAVDTWGRYLQEWTLWNHVRTAAALAACTLFSGILWLTP